MENEEENILFQPSNEEYISHFERLLQKMEKVVQKLEKTESAKIGVKEVKERKLILKKDDYEQKISTMKANQKNEKYIILKISSEIIFTKYLLFLGQDSEDKIVKVMIHNLETIFYNVNYFSLKDFFSQNKYIFILSPFYTKFSDGFNGIKVEEPKEIYLFENLESCINFVKQCKGISNKEMKIKAEEYIKKKNLGKVIECYKKALEIDSNDVEVLSALANIYLSLPYYTKTFDYINKACNLSPNNKNFITIKLLALIGLKRYNEAICLIQNFEFFNDDEGIQKVRGDLFKKLINQKGQYDFIALFSQEKKEGGLLDISEYTNNKVGFDFNKEKGIFAYAKNDIRKGELLIVKKSIFSLLQKSNQTQKEIEEDNKTIIDTTTFRIKNATLDYEDFFLLYDENNLNQNIYQRKLNIKNEIRKEDIIKILNNNMFTSMRNLLANLNVSKGLWTLPSLFNHNCLPNTIFLGIGDHVFIYAQANVKKDEELTVGYVSCEVEYTERQKQLKQNYNFKCKCELCTFEKSKLEKIAEKTILNDYIIKMNNNLNQQNYNDLDLNIEKFLEENKKKFSCYEMGVAYLLLGILFGKNQPIKGIEYFEKCLRYVKDRFFKLHCNCLFYLFCLNQLNKNMEKCNEYRNEIYKTLKSFFNEESIVNQLMSESEIKN